MSEAWLPALLRFEDSNGNWDEYIECLYRQFEADFVHSKPHWPGKRVGHKRHPEQAGKSATFWHLFSEGEREAERLPDFRRCERIAWPRPMMDEFDAAPPDTTGFRLVWWKERRGSEDRYLLAPSDFSYVVVVADRGDFVLPWTAYSVEQSHRQDKLRRRWAEFWNARNG